jgi:hypothetical protein
MKQHTFKEMEARKRLEKYLGIALGVVLVMAFVLVQPTMNQAYSVGVAGLPAYDDCIVGDGFVGSQPEDPISMNTVRSGNIVKTIHAEKEIFECLLDQGNLLVIVDITTYIEIYEHIDDREVIETNAVATTCIKDEGTAAVIDCESYNIPSTPVPVGSNCNEIGDVYITHPQEMNTVNKGKIAKTVESQKEVFICLIGDFEKKVEIILFTDIYEDLSTQTVLETQFHSMRCVVLVSDLGGDFIDGTVETCQFSTIEN